MSTTDPNVAPPPYSEEELQRYFERREARRPRPENQKDTFPPVTKRVYQVLAGLAAFLAIGMVGTGIYFLSLTNDLPSLQMIENPELRHATVAYTADGVELARFARENRTSVSLNQISPYVIQALVATEDHRFEEHWGIDIFRTVSALTKTVLGKVGLPFDQQGGSTISQQLARNLYVSVGFDVTPERKLKEMLTAIQIERSYTKQEIIEMYLNTVPFNNNAYGIQAAAQTYFNKSAKDLSVNESALLVGMLKGTALYNPVRNPERAQGRRNVVLQQMVKHGYLTDAQYAELRTEPIQLDFNPISHELNFAPYFAEKVRLWLDRWGKQNGYDIYTEGLIVHTTLDSEMQRLAHQALVEEMNKLQAVVDIEWSAARAPFSSQSTGAEDQYLQWAQNNADKFEPFAYFWERNGRLLDEYIRATDRFRTLRESGVNEREALAQLKQNEAFVDSVKAIRSRLEGGMVAMDPHTGYVKAWVGGRDYKVEKFDHIVDAKRQPGSTFKPFLYATAIDNNWSPYYMLLDDTLNVRAGDGSIWSPRNSGGMSGQYMTLREALRQSVNTVSARLMLEVGPERVVDYAHKMGIDSELEAVYALALGTSDVTLLEMTRAYSTFANYGQRVEPVMVTRIEDRFGNLIAEFEPMATEVLSPNTAYTMVDILRGVVQGGGTGSRMYWKYGLTQYDLAGKTGTTQNSADGWFMLMHPELVTGAWVGFNDRRIAFRTSWWGQGAHNALHLVGNFWKKMDDSGEITLARTPFEPPANYSVPMPYFERPDDDRRGEERRSWGSAGEKEDRRRRGRIGW